MVYLDSMFHVVPDEPGDEPTLDQDGVGGGTAAYAIPEEQFTPLGWQAREIIASILDDTSPGLAEVHWRLRRCLAAHPGSPERALLAHLKETTELVNHGTG